MEALRDALIEGHKNDEVKYMLPEAYKTQLVMTINARSLRNLFELRMDKHAMKEFQALAYQMFAQLPEDHWFLFKDIFDDK
jgi:thymidylate synthase (FAD)